MTGFPRKVRDIVLARADGRCERCGFYIDAVQLHHRRARGMGGSTAPDTNTPANALALCPGCHRDVESLRVDAVNLGFLVEQGQDPEQKPVFRLGQWVLLHDDGSVEVRASNRNDFYRMGLCASCGQKPHSPGRPRCDECHRDHNDRANKGVR